MTHEALREQADRAAKIGLMYLDGDAFEGMLLDRAGDTDYDFDAFIQVKRSLAFLERIEEGAKLCAVLWQAYPDNPGLSVPVAAGSSLPLEGWTRTRTSAELAAVYSRGERPIRKDPAAGTTHYYYPVRNSDAEIVGALELIAGLAVAADL
ncbi:hypothetical protein [Paenibacillus sp.]|uniref:hypothetical protein n=1 Tax=Paenibacillus sp. TaxID=58172 RepID=UPI002811A907|nr:hypothetical protein [Paenibacillus sp.]